MKNGMGYIRKTYGVPARRGGCILYKQEPGVILSARFGHLRVRMEQDGKVVTLHPTWSVVYIDKAAPAQDRAPHEATTRQSPRG